LVAILPLLACRLPERSPEMLHRSMAIWHAGAAFQDICAMQQALVWPNRAALYGGQGGESGRGRAKSGEALNSPPGAPFAKPRVPWLLSRSIAALPDFCDHVGGQIRVNGKRNLDKESTVF
jgi:hypothetical protein